MFLSAKLAHLLSSDREDFGKWKMRDGFLEDDQTSPVLVDVLGLVPEDALGSLCTGFELSKKVLSLRRRT